MQKIGFSEVRSVDKQISDSKLELAKQAYFDEFHRYGSEQHRNPHGLQWLLGEETFDWHFLCVPYVDKTLPEKNEPFQDPRGYCFQILRASFYRLWREDGKPQEERSPHFYQTHGLPSRFWVPDLSEIGKEEREKDQMTKLNRVVPRNTVAGNSLPAGVLSAKRYLSLDLLGSKIWRCGFVSSWKSRRYSMLWHYPLNQVNNEISSDQYKFTFEDFLFGETPSFFIEYPSETFEKTFDFEKVIRSGLEQRRKCGALPEYAQRFLDDVTSAEFSVIDFLKARSDNARKYIRSNIEKNEQYIRSALQELTHEKPQWLDHVQRFLDASDIHPGDIYNAIELLEKWSAKDLLEAVKALLKYRLVKWVYHPIFQKENNKFDNFFAKIPLFHGKVFSSWCFVFFKGNTVKEPGHLKEAGKRLDREIRNFMALKTYRRISDLVPRPLEFIESVGEMPRIAEWSEEDISKIRKKSDRHLLYHLFRVAMSLGAPYFHHVDNNDTKNEYLFSRSASPDYTTPDPKYQTVLYSQNTFIAFQAEQNIPYLFDRVNRYCKNADVTEGILW